MGRRSHRGLRGWETRGPIGPMPTGTTYLVVVKLTLILIVSPVSSAYGHAATSHAYEVMLLGKLISRNSRSVTEKLVGSNIALVHACNGERIGYCRHESRRTGDVVGRLRLVAEVVFHKLRVDVTSPSRPSLARIARLSHRRDEAKVRVLLFPVPEFIEERRVVRGAIAINQREPL